MPGAAVKIELPLGDIIDRISILQIKAERLADAEQLANVQRALASLRADWAAEAYPVPEALDDWPALHGVNQKLWDVEDRLRAHEAEARFDETFVGLARSVYQLNDERAALKRAINRSLRSKLVEEKSYRNG
jgi:hypothetical protein